MMYILFFIYGLYAATNDGISKAWISKVVPSSETATAIGFNASCTSIVTMISSSLAGLIWTVFNPSAMFLFSAVGVFMAIIYFAAQTKREE
jgi:MFS family permease